NLKQMALSLKMYASEDRTEIFPTVKVSSCQPRVYESWNWIFDTNAMYPEYLPDLNTMVCPSFSSGMNAVEVWDKGHTPNAKWVVSNNPQLGVSNDGKVTPCEVIVEP